MMPFEFQTSFAQSYSSDRSITNKPALWNTSSSCQMKIFERKLFFFFLHLRSLLCIHSFIHTRPRFYQRKLMILINKRGLWNTSFLSPQAQKTIPSKSRFYNRILYMKDFSRWSGNKKKIFPRNIPYLVCTWLQRHHIVILKQFQRQQNL